MILLPFFYQRSIYFPYFKILFRKLYGLESILSKVFKFWVQTTLYFSIPTERNFP